MRVTVPTLMDSYRKHASVDREDIMINIEDTCGGLCLTWIEKELKTGDGFVVVFSVDDMGSFDSASYIIKKLTLMIYHQYYLLLINVILKIGEYPLLMDILWRSVMAYRTLKLPQN